VIGSGFAAQCGICRRFFHGKCIELSRTTAHEVDLHKMELMCTACAVPAVLGKSYLRHHQLLSAVSLFKAACDYSLYLEVCRLGKLSLVIQSATDFFTNVCMSRLFSLQDFGLGDACRLSPLFS
jgi:hypothetical protein